MRVCTGRLATGLILLLAAAHAAAQEDMTARVGDRPKSSGRVNATYEENLEKYKGVADLLILPGLVANRKAKRIEIMAEATGLSEGSFVEFLLIGCNSGKGYEALLWSHAKPSDVHKALVFIGMRPGEPFNPARLRFWSKGERVCLRVGPEEDVGQFAALTALERFVVDKNTGEPLPQAGFVFAGSFMMNKPGEKSERVYAADFLEPQSVASVYNDPIAVLDVPRRARRSAVYGAQVVSPEYDFEKNELLTIVLEPEHKDGRRRVKEMTLEVRRSAEKIPRAPESEGPAVSLPKFEFLLTDAAGKRVGDTPELPVVLGVFETVIKNGQDPYVSVHFDRAMRLADVKKTCRLIGAIDSESGIRVEPPATGQLYYQAFLPAAEWKDRERRMWQPWELCLTQKQGKVSGTFTLYESVLRRGSTKPEMKVTRLAVDTPETLRKQLDLDAQRRKLAERGPRPPILVVFADADLTYGQLLEFLSLALTTHNMIHVFLESEASGR